MSLTPPTTSQTDEGAEVTATVSYKYFADMNRLNSDLISERGNTDLDLLQNFHITLSLSLKGLSSPAIRNFCMLATQTDMCYTLDDMGMMRHIITRAQKLLLSLAMMTLGGYYLSAAEDSHPETTRNPLSVGVIVPLSGDLAWFGVAFKRGIELAQTEGNARAVAFSFEDDRSGDRVATISALNSLIRNKQIRVSVFTGAPSAAVVSPILDKTGVLGFSAIDSNSKLLTLGNNVFGYGYSNELTSEQIASYACRTLHAKKVAIVGANDEWSMHAVVWFFRMTL
jgi:ABC-type branched-subunit amino acid transport system substrate-binding protein